MSTNTQKLRVLRSRTDHDLLILIQRELERGMTLIELATSRNSPLRAQAQKAYDTASAIFPRIVGVSPGDRVSIEAKLRELRSRLDPVPASASLRAYPASFAS